ncbi:NHS-like protein 3 [Palaemon carinicauda]|uniref:NHS-like protein 3 n=1 Tax=Palaemon carinicauda TaxID=392227 RepID=UPI0035B5F561
MGKRGDKLTLGQVSRLEDSPVSLGETGPDTSDLSVGDSVSTGRSKKEVSRNKIIFWLCETIRESLFLDQRDSLVTSQDQSSGNVAEGSPPPSEDTLRGEGSPTVSPPDGSSSWGSALTETPLRRTDDPDTLPRGRIRRKARRPLRSRGLPSPYKGVKRCLFGSSSPVPPPKEEPSSLEQTFAAATLDLSADRSRSPTPARSSDLPSPFLAADALWAPSHPVIQQAPIPSGKRDSTHGVGKSLARQGSPARPPARSCAVAHKHSPELQSSDLTRQRSPARQRSPTRRSPAKQRPHVPDVLKVHPRSPKRLRSPVRSRTTAQPVPDACQARQQPPPRPRSPDLDLGKGSIPSPRPCASAHPSAPAQSSCSRAFTCAFVSFHLF